MKKTLKSGSTIEISLVPFSDANKLNKAVANELKSLKFDNDTEIGIGLYKDIFCSVLCSEKIDEALSLCMKRCAYNGLKIDRDTFESEDARQDYFDVCYEVMTEVLRPFVKGLSLQFGGLFEKKAK